jgi:hypothetical protein
MSPGRLSIGALALALASALASLAGCRQLDQFTTNGDHFEGTIVAADFSRTGIAPDTTMCLTFDADRIQASPGTLSTSDGSFTHSAMRPLPQLLNDPLSLYTFGEGRIKNLIYAAHTTPPDAGAGTAPDPLLFVSLLQSDDIEVRVVRGAPELGDAAAPPGAGTPVFAVFPLSRKPGPCTY